MTELETRVAAPPPAVLGWLRAALWAYDVEVEFVPGGSGDLTFVAEPSAAEPELLVPARPARATATVARRSSDARTLGGRVRTTAVESAAALGLVPRLAPGRLVSVRLGPGAEDPERSLPARLASRLGTSGLVFAVTMGGARYNRKPVLTLFDPDGELVAFAKLGVDRGTDGFVANEARWLTAITDSAPQGLEVPSVRWAGPWRGHELLVSTPVRPPRLPVHRPTAPPAPDLVEAVAAVRAEGRVPVPSSAVVHRAGAVDHPDLAAAVARVSERHAGVAVRTGLWHGDLSPWNIASRRRRPPLVWDWEAAEAGRPVGADALHGRVMVATHLRGTRPDVALAALAPDDVGPHQPDDRARAAALDLYLLDVARRDLEIVATGVDPGLLPGIGAAALDRLVPA